MSDLDDQIAAMQAAIAATVTGADTALSTLGDMTADLRALSIAIQEASAAGLAVVAPAPAEPDTVITHGADPTGVADSTAAINAAIAAGDGIFTAGTYKVTAGSDNGKAILITAGKSIVFDDSDGPIEIVLASNSKTRYYIIRGDGDGISITGKATITGDRLSHNYTAGSTHEWGCGIFINGDGTLIEDVTVRRCTGDGFGLVGDDIVMNRAIGTENRRQGASAYDVDNLVCNDCEFTLTGALLNDGAAPNGPCAGFDMEPDSAGTATATFNRCKFNGNRAGFLAWLRSEVGGSITVTLNDCQFVGNANGANSKALAGSITCTTNRGSFVNNRGSGIRIEAGSSWTVSDNLFDSVTERTDFTKTGTDSRTVNDIRILTGGSATVNTNKYV